MPPAQLRPRRHIVVASTASSQPTTTDDPRNSRSTGLPTARNAAFIVCRADGEASTSTGIVDGEVPETESRFTMPCLDLVSRLPRLRSRRVEPTDPRQSQSVEHRIARARDALVAKINRVRPKQLRRPRWQSVPEGLSQVTSGQQPLGHHTSHTLHREPGPCRSGLEHAASTTSVESSTTFRFCHADSYENILLSQRSDGRRSMSEVTLDSGEEVLSRLRAMKRIPITSQLSQSYHLPRVSRAPTGPAHQDRETHPAAPAGPQLPTLQEERPAPAPRARRSAQPGQSGTPADLRSLSMSPRSLPTPAASGSRVGSMPTAKRRAPIKPPRSRYPCLESPASSSSLSSHPTSLSDPPSLPRTQPRSRSRHNSSVQNPECSPLSSGHQSSVSTTTASAAAVGSLRILRERWSATPAPVSPREAPAPPPRSLPRRQQRRARITPATPRSSLFREAFQSDLPNSGDPTLEDTRSRKSSSSLQQIGDKSATSSQSSSNHNTLTNELNQIGYSISSWTQSELGVQDVDNGFFENFARLPHRQETLKQSTRHQMRQMIDDVVVSISQTGGSPAGRSQSITCSPDQTEDLYVEALHTLKQPIGCDAPSEEQIRQAEQLLLDIFNPTEEQKQSCMAKLADMESPDLCLECTVISASGLTAMDANGLSDPFCVIKVNGEERRETSVCSNTLNPVWNQRFKLALKDPLSDVVEFDVWDYDAEENLAQRLGKFSDIKGVKGFTRFMKDMAKGNRPDSLGHVRINIKDIPALGVESLYKLLSASSRGDQSSGRPRPHKERGRLRLRMRLLDQRRLSECRPLEMHAQLLRAVIGEERGLYQGEDYTWSAQRLSEPARALIDQHAARCNLDQMELAITRWDAYSQIHCVAPMDYMFLFTTLQTVRAFLQNDSISDDDMSSLVESLFRFADHCYETVRTHRHSFDTANTSNVCSMDCLLRCLFLIAEMMHNTRLSESVQRYTMENIQSAARHHNREKLATPRRYVMSALRHGNDDWYRQAYSSAKRDSDEVTVSEQEARCQKLILLINMLYADVEGALESYDQIFRRNMEINYSYTAYFQFAGKLKHEIGPIVEELSRSLPCVQYQDDEGGRTSPQQGLDMGTSLFELYLAVQQFTSLISQLRREDAAGGTEEESPLRNSHIWFSDAVNRWLDIACYKAMHRIKRAIELDQATEVHSYVNHSSSAVDTVTVFYQIKTFWNQLNWPDPVGSYGFVIKVLDDIVRSGAFYVRQMHSSLRGQQYLSSQQPFHFTQQLCLAINSVEFVREQIQRLPAELSFETIFTAMEEQMGSEGTINCRATLQNIIDQASEDVEQAIIDLIDGVVAQLLPQVNSFLQQLSSSSGQLMQTDSILFYLHSNLMLMYPRLNPLNLRRALQCIWRQLVHALHQHAVSCRKKDSEYFVTLLSLLSSLVECINGDNKGLSMDLIHTDGYAKLDRWLNLYKCGPDKLVSMYFSRKFSAQQEADSINYGKLSVKAYFVENVLRVELLNARDLKPPDPDSCNPYIKFQLHPVSAAPNMERAKTKIHSKTVYPLFDEVFEFTMDREMLVERDGCLVFTVKNHRKLKQSEVLGEAVIPVAELATLNHNQIKEAHQQILNILSCKVLPELQEVFTAIEDKRTWSSAADLHVRSTEKRSHTDRRFSITDSTMALPRLLVNSFIASSTAALNSSP